MIGDRRAAEAPPCDSLAECIVLRRFLFNPRRIAELELEPLLVFPEHRWIWRVMVDVRRTHTGAADGTFYTQWLFELMRRYPDKWEALANLTCCADEESARSWEEADDDPHRENGRMLFSRYQHSLDWWLDRLRRIAEARHGIQAAQRIAEGYWRVPDRPFSGAEAAAILEKAVPPQRPTLADRVLHV